MVYGNVITPWRFVWYTKEGAWTKKKAGGVLYGNVRTITLKP